MKLLKIKLLGGFSVEMAGQPLTAFRSAKSRALLAYLAAQPDQPHPRTTLATLLWGDLPETAAKTNLRIELSSLNKTLREHPALEISRNEVCFRSALAEVDAVSLQRTVAEFHKLPPEAQSNQLSKLAAAIDDYRGGFLAGFQLSDAVEFDEWQLFSQEHLHEQMMQALNTLQLRYAEQGRWQSLAAVAQRQLALVPWLESAHRNLIQALAAQGKTQAAIDQYRKCCAVLREELGVEPSLATQEVGNRLHTDETETMTTQVAKQPIVRHNLAQQANVLVGRESETAQLLDLVRGKRLVTLLGIGGVGKSRLAQAVAQKTIHDFVDGVWFVPLANIEDSESAPNRIALAIAATIGFPITDTQSPLTALVNHLAEQKMLLVLDNWEHLISAAEAIFDPLLAQTGCHMLATSRVRLGLELEIPVEIAGLQPDAALTLFLDRARRVVPRFATGKEGEGLENAIRTICAQVAGLPLGIEMAASWVEHFSVAEMGKSLAEIAMEPKQADRMVARHQSLVSVFKYSWRLLSSHQQQILSRFSIFRGGFDRKAATTIASSSLSDLSNLLAHSLVQRIQSGRYDLHPLIQEFAAQKLNTDEAEPLARNYYQHYLTTLTNCEKSQYAAQLWIDFENIRSAWQWAIQKSDAVAIQQASSSFGEFMIRFGVMTDGERLFGEALACFENIPNQQELLAQVLDQQVYFLLSIYGVASASAAQHRVLTLTNNPKLKIRAHSDLASHYSEVGEWEQADFHYASAEAIAQEMADLEMQIETVTDRIYVQALHFRGDFAAGIAQLEEMLKSLEEATLATENKEELCIKLMRRLALVAMRYRDYAKAIRYTKQMVEQAKAQGHRPYTCYNLLDLALAEQFAGLYPDAIAHNLEALALAKAMKNYNESGLLKANLCLSLRQHGDLAGALEYGLQSIQELNALGEARMEGQARNRVGHTLSALESWPEADIAYTEAQKVWETLQHPNRYEAVAGRAVAALHLGRKDEALKLVDEVLTFVTHQQQMNGIVEPVLLLLNCETVLSALGQTEQARGVLQLAQEWAETVAERISDDRIREIFLTQRPDVQLLKSHLQFYK